MVDSQQITVAISRRIRGLPLAVAVAWVTVNARRSQVSRSESFEGLCIVSEVTFKDSLTEFEGQLQLFVVYHDGCLVFVATGGDVVGGAELTTRIPFVGREVTYRLSNIFSVFHIALTADIWVIVLTGRKSHGHQSCKD